MNLVGQPAAASGQPAPPSPAERPWWLNAARTLAASAFFDIVLIVWFAFAFARPVLNFNDQHMPASTDDWQDLTSSMELARESILDHRELPLWDPYFGTGTPYLAEPKTFLLNPVASVPTLIFGVYDGPKISAALSMALAGAGLYYLAGILGISRPWRLWAGVLMSISGAFVGRVFPGHYQFIIGLGFVPWAFGLSMHALRRPRLLFPILAGVANAMLFSSGLVLYTVFAIPGLALTLLFVAADEVRAAGERREEALVSVLGRALQIAGWTLGFAAIQFVPIWQSIGNFPAPKYHLEGGETIFGTFNNFYISDLKHLGPDPSYPLWGWWEYYFYIGFVPLVGAGLAVLALIRKGRRFAALWAAALFGLYLAWAAAPHTFFKWIYDAYQPLYQFRVPSRALNFATPFLILLAALGFNTLTEWLRPYFAIKLRVRLSWGRFAAASAIVIGLAASCLYGLDDVYDTNRPQLSGRDRFSDQREVAHWLRDRHPGVYSVQAPYLGQAVPPEFYRLHMIRLDARWEYSYTAPTPAANMEATIERRAPYFIGLATDVVPNSTAVGAVGDWVVYRQQNAPPFASTLTTAQPPTGPDYPWDSLSTPAQARIVSANVIEVRAQPAAGQDRLLLLESYHSGWRVEIDGKRAGRADNFGTFLSVPARPGMHTYTFVFDPRSVRIGGAITIGTILGALLLAGWQFVERRRARP